MSRVVRVVAALVLVACGSDSITAPSQSDITSVFPTGWSRAGGVSATYVVGMDRATVHSGKVAMAMAGTDSASAFFTGFGQAIKADAYRGKRVRFTAWVRGENIRASVAGLWMRVDSDDQTEAFDNSFAHPEKGTTGWHQYTIILDVPNDAAGIAFGALLHGSGVLVVDDMTFEVIPATGATTDQLLQPVSIPAGQAAYYSQFPAGPINLDFES
jgi:hypothetical protein